MRGCSANLHVTGRDEGTQSGKHRRLSGFFPQFHLARLVGLGLHLDPVGGPQSDTDREGDEIPLWFVYVGDEDAEAVETVYKCQTFAGAERLAKRMAHDRRLELIHEATPD